MKSPGEIPGIAQSFNTLCVSPDGRDVAAAEVLYAGESGSDTNRVFDMEERTEILALTPHDNRATALSFSPDGKRLLAGYSDGTGEILDFVVKEATIETRENI